MTGEAVAGLSVSGPTSRLGPDDIERLSVPVMDAAHALTRAIVGAAD